jgi:KUP system potassium uptake protein
MALLTTWRRGRDLINDRLRRDSLPLEKLTSQAAARQAVRAPGTAVYLTRISEGLPPALLRNWKHNRALHERIVLLTILTEGTPYVSEQERIEVEHLGSGFYRVVLHYGFLEDPVVPAALERVEAPGLAIDAKETTYFLGRETVFATRHPGMALWRERLFAFMARNARSATLFFGLPPERVVEMGAQIEI